jgi:cytochrome c biogenesis protein CcmG/thiol:disulfide interchange protein DsbE
MNRWLGALLGLTVAVLLLSPAGRAPSEVRPEVGYLAPPIAARDTRGRQVSLADLRGQVVVLNFWATWCPPCRAEMPELQAFHAEGRPGIAVVGVDMGDQDVPEAELIGFLQRHGYTYPVWLDARGEANRTYRVRSVPTTFFVDKDGVIRYKYLGPMTTAVIREGVRAAGGER